MSSSLSAIAKSSEKMPVLFIGHGSPLNALQENNFTRALTDLGRTLPKPQAIVVISAHWQTTGQTLVDVQESPPTIHDFSGFPPALSQMTYPAPGASGLAQNVARTLALQHACAPDTHWGLDHGAWSVLVRLYPKADIPVFQLSLDESASGAEHYELGKALSFLRHQGVLILASGGLVHNLRELDRVADSKTASRPWAQAFDDRVTAALRQREDRALVNYPTLHPAAPLAVPTPEHYLPLLYALGAADPAEKPQFPFEGFQYGTLSLRCVRFG